MRLILQYGSLVYTASYEFDISINANSFWTNTRSTVVFDTSKAYITIAIRLRHDYDPTTTHHARLLPFDASKK